MRREFQWNGQPREQWPDWLRERSDVQIGAANGWLVIVASEPTIIRLGGTIVEDDAGKLARG